MTSRPHQAVVEVFLAALDRSDDQRSAYLDAVCESDQDFRREVEELLEHHDPRPLIQDDHSNPIVALLELPLRAVPDDRYEIREEIARGGMGVILRARDNEIGREVAIKVLHESLDRSPDALTRFVAEAQIAGQLQHPGIAPVYELGELPDGRPFFAMELVAGQSLSRILKQQATDRDGLIDIYERVCQTVAFAHSRGVIHRDLKPANVMVGTFGQVQVIDWGLAKVLAGDGSIPEPTDMPQTVREESTDTSRGVSVTQVGIGMGTLGYASPEQSLGEKVGHASDVFSLGAILCEILTGTPAVAGPVEPKGDSEDPAGDPVEPLRRLDRCPADKELVQLARACLAADPADRPPDAVAVARRISEYKLSVHARLQEAERASARAEASVAEERKRRVLTLGLAATTVLLCTVGLGTWIWLDAAHRQQLVERQRRETLVTQSIQGALADAIRLGELAQTASLTQVEPWARAVEAAERAEALTAHSAVDSRLSAEINETLTTLRRETRTRRFFADIATARIPPDDVLLHSYNSKRMAERFTKAFRAYGIEPIVMEPEPAAAILRKQCGSFFPEAVHVANQWWLFDPRGRKTEETGKWVRRFVDALDSDPWRHSWRDEIGRTNQNREAMLALIRDPATLDRPLGDLVNLAQGMQRTRRPWLGEIVRFLQAAERRHPRSVWIKYWIADMTARWDSPQSTQQGLRYSQALIVLHPTGVNRVLHATLLRKAGLRENAEAELRDVLLKHPQHVAALFEMAQIHASAGRWQRTLEALDAVTAASSEASAIGSNVRSGSRIGIGLRGRAYLALGRYEEAAELYEALVESMPREAFRHYHNLGKTRLAMKQYEEAIEAFQSVEPKDGRTWTRLAEAYLAIDDVDQAVTAARAAAEKSPADAQPYYLLAVALAQQRKWGRVVETYRTAFARDPAAGSRVTQLTSAARAAMRASGDESIADLQRNQLLHTARIWLQSAVDHATDDKPRLLAGLLTDDDFSRVRDDPGSARLPVDERRAWNGIWQKMRRASAEP